MIDTLKRWRWALAITIVVLLGLAYSFWPRAVEVDLDRVSKGPMSVGVTDDGVTRAREFYTVTAPVTGYVRRIELKPGDPIRSGDLVAQVTGRPSAPLDQRMREVLEGTLIAAQATMRSTSESLAQAQRDLQRSEALARSGFLPPAQLEIARTRVSTGQAALEQNRAEAQRIAALLAAPGATARDRPVPVRAPASGSVLTVINESEGVIAEGATLMTIGDPAQIEIVVDLLSRDAVQVRPGDRVEVTQWGGSAPLIGRVTRIEPFGRLKVSALGIEEQRVNVIVGLDPAVARTAARLGHGYQVEATIVLWSKADALRVPIGALFRAPNGAWAVFVVREGRAQQAMVDLGQLNDDYGEAIAGLREGEQVILNPGAQLKAGSRVRGRAG